MDIGRIVGSITSVSKIEELKSLKLYLIHILDSELKNTGNYMVAVDTIGSGYGDRILVTTGSAAKMTKVTIGVPVDASIVARIDPEEKEI